MLPPVSVPSAARQSRVASDSSQLPHTSGSSRRARSASSVSLPGVDRSSSSTTSSSADSASHTDGSFGQSDKMSEHQTVLLDEIHRLTTENASLHHKLESSVVAPQTPEAKENGTAHSGLREQNKTLANENSRLQEQIAQLERRILTGDLLPPFQTCADLCRAVQLCADCYAWRTSPIACGVWLPLGQHAYGSPACMFITDVHHCSGTLGMELLLLCFQGLFQAC